MTQNANISIFFCDFRIESLRTHSLDRVAKKILILLSILLQNTFTRQGTSRSDNFRMNLLSHFLPKYAFRDFCPVYLVRAEILTTKSISKRGVLKIY